MYLLLLCQAPAFPATSLAQQASRMHTPLILCWEVWGLVEERTFSRRREGCLESEIQ